MFLAAALALFTVTQTLPDEYPFGPFTDPEAARVAARTEQRLAKPDGIAFAVELNCQNEWGGGGWEVDELVAREFLIRNFDRALPALLERMRREDADDASDHARLCGAGARYLIAEAVCFGYAIGGSGPALDAHPQAVAARSRVADAFVKALEGKRLPRNLLLDALLDALDSGRAGRAYSLASKDLCTGGRDVVYRATRPLLEVLGAPTKKRLPPPAFVPETNRDKAFRLLSYGVANRWVAEAKVRPFLDQAETLPLAAVTLERMGADASSAVLRLDQMLDALEFSGNLADDAEEFDLLRDSFDLFMLLGPRANPALPALGRVAARYELPACHTFGTRNYVEVARATYVRGRAQNSVAVLEPLLRCPQGDQIADALGEFGQAAVAPLRAALRDTTLTVETRSGAATVLLEVLGQELSEGDRKLVGHADR